MLGLHYRPDGPPVVSHGLAKGENLERRDGAASWSRVHRPESREGGENQSGTGKGPCQKDSSLHHDNPALIRLDKGFKPQHPPRTRSTKKCYHAAAYQVFAQPSSENPKQSLANYRAPGPPPWPCWSS